MSDNRRVDYEIKANVGYIYLNRPPVNAIDHQMLDAFHDALLMADTDPKVRAVVITSKLNKMFCGGMDLKMVLAGDVDNLRRFVHKFYLGTMDIQYNMRKPTIVAINGPARGAGMSLAITSDMVIAADEVDIGYPEINIGIIPAIHFVHLPRQISRHKAFELLFGGQPIMATEAVELGLINHAVPDDTLFDAVSEFAAQFVNKSPTVMRLARQSFMRANDLDYRRNIENQIETLCNVFQTPDAREGLRAFLEKRAPAWQAAP